MNLQFLAGSKGSFAALLHLQKRETRTLCAGFFMLNRELSVSAFAVDDQRCFASPTNHYPLTTIRCNLNFGTAFAVRKAEFILKTKIHNHEHQTIGRQGSR